MDSPEHCELSKRFDHALTCAADWHRSQCRKGTNIPYVSHLLQVAGLVLEHGGTEDEAIAALLHDAVEDNKATLNEIRNEFGDEVAGMVEDCSDSHGGKKKAWKVRKECYIASIAHKPEGSRLVSAADKLHNARAILRDYRRCGDQVFRRFNAGKEGTLWYYRALVNAFRAAGTNPDLIDELDRVVTELENLAGVQTSRRRSPSDREQPS
jgi:(p)ppGpp synthase/HD superfamily hydrolase